MNKIIKIESPFQTIFYTIEKAIKEYRRFAQRNLNAKIGDITIDQALLLLALNDQPDLSQNKISELVFKDNASVTRMIELMTKKDYLKRSINNQDRRKYILAKTSKGEKILKNISSTVLANRTTALNGITKEELELLKSILDKLITNCNTQD